MSSLNSHIWRAAPILDSTDIVHYARRVYKTAKHQSFKVHSSLKKCRSYPCQSLLIKKTTDPNVIRGKLKRLVPILLDISNWQLKQ